MALSVSTTNYEIPQSENDDITHSCFKYMLDRQFALSAWFEELGGEKKYFLGPAEVKCNACTCLGCLAQPPEFILHTGLTLAMCIPSLCVDYCQGMMGNQTSWNSIIADKKLLRVNDEIILSDEFTADEMLSIQYKMGNMFEYLLNRKNYHHSATFPLLLGNARNINASLVVKHKNRVTGKIFHIYRSGNVRIEFNSDDDEKDKFFTNNIKIFTVSPLIIERVNYNTEEALVYMENKKYIKKGQWMEFMKMSELNLPDYENPYHPNYHAPVDKLIPCLACTGIIISLFCSQPSCYGCNLQGDFLCCDNICTCCKVSKKEDNFCVCFNAKISCIKPQSLCKCLYQCFCFDCRMKFPDDTKRARTSVDFPCFCTVCSCTICNQYQFYGPKLLRTVEYMKTHV